MSDEDAGNYVNEVTRCLRDGVDGDNLDSDLLNPDTFELTPDKYLPYQTSDNDTMTFSQLYNCSIETRESMNNNLSHNFNDAVVPNEEVDPEAMIEINSQSIRRNAERFLEKGEALSLIHI